MRVPGPWVYPVFGSVSVRGLCGTSLSPVTAAMIPLMKMILAIEILSVPVAIA